MAGPEVAAPDSAGPERTPESSGLGAPYSWFLVGAGSWFGAMGMHQTLISWLVVGELRASDEVTGLVQMTTMLPGLLLLFVGGAVADRVDPRRMLLGVHALGTLPPLALAWGVATDRLSIPFLVTCALALSILNPFCFPSRERMLWETGNRRLERAVVGQTMAQFGSQALGMRIAGFARQFGSAPMLVVQSLVIALGLLSTLRLPAVPPAPLRVKPSWNELLAGFWFVMRSDLRSVWFLVFGVGLFFSGAYWTVIPLMLRAHYAGDVGELAVLLSMFQLGTMAGSAFLLFRGGVERKGVTFVVALCVGAGCLIAMGSHLPYPLVIASNFVWGLAGGFFMNTSRTLFQLRAPAAERARVLAMNQFGFMAAAPLGAALAGLLSGQIGPLNTMIALGCAMLSLIAIVTAAGPVLRLR